MKNRNMDIACPDTSCLARVRKISRNPALAVQAHPPYHYRPDALDGPNVRA